ncbi:hypothetical protein E2146_04670 [Oenococcus oeni]|nr:hypothetical protein E2146_04670 [Oenococcus oeni]TEU59031.1 hypothetical protein E2142_02930 [Oenococcus oeni]TEU59266.1 hypothetical protein E2144_08145 [Oenococcus oeni]
MLENWAMPSHKDLYKNNASNTEAGFHFQDFCALYIFLKSVDEIDYMNVEGEEDIVVAFLNQKKSFYQVKDAIDPFIELRKSKIDDSIKVLAKDMFNNKSSCEELVFVTNSNYPMGNHSELNFSNSYVKYSCDKNFPMADKIDIEKRVTRIIKKLEYNMAPDIFIKKFKFLKLQFYGADDDTKLSLLKNATEEFLVKCSISIALTDALLKEWRSEIIEIDENPTSSLKKIDFLAHTSVTILDKQMEFEKFYDAFDISQTDEGFIETHYSDFLEKLKFDFQSFSQLDGLVDKFRQSRKKANETRQDAFVNFINANYASLCKTLGLEQEDQGDIAKLILWDAIRQGTIVRKIKKGINLE